jgi:hypothetical protein
MSFHARPILTPANVPGGRHDPSRLQVRLTSPVDDPPTSPPVTTRARAAVAEPTAADAVEAPTQPIATEAPQHETKTTSAPERAMPWPWYRREPWLSVAMAAFVPIGVGFALPEELHVLLLGMSALLVLLGVAMLIRQGPFREHPRPEAASR